MGATGEIGSTASGLANGSSAQTNRFLCRSGAGWASKSFWSRSPSATSEALTQLLKFDCVDAGPR
jgi:hypothetical protein